MKQYGKHIKAFEKRCDTPLKDKRNTKISELYGIKYERNMMMPSYVRKGSIRISCYEDLVYFANKDER